MTAGAVRRVHVIQGEYHVSDDPNVVLTTILGSCVAVTVWHPARRLGGMCHFMLPERLGVRSSGADGRYATEAIDWLVARMLEHASHPCEYEAKLFGGGRMFDRAAPAGADSVGDIHRRNAATARQLVARHGLQIKGEDLGGHGHRQVMFELPNGYAWVRHTPLRPAADPPAAAALA